MPRVTIGNLPTTTTPTQSYTPDITDKSYKHSIVDVKRQPLGALLTHIEGSSWSVDYYSQVLGASEEVAPYDYNQAGVYQQYLYIKRMELKLQGQLNTTVDPTDQTVTVGGTAIMYPYMKPNFGDAFIAEIGDGNAGLFTITEVEKKSLFKQACYEVQFTLVKYVDEDIETNINSKVVKTTEFIRDFMTYGQNPIIATSEKLKYDNLTNLLDDTLNDWLGEFYSNEFRTILVPNGSTPTYDPFLTRMITKIFNKDEYPIIKQIDLLNVDDHNLNYYTDIWSVLLKRELYMLRPCFDEYYLVNSKQLNGNPFLQTAYYAGIKMIVLPKPEGNLADERIGLTGILSGGMLTGTDIPAVGFTLPAMVNNNNYIFSQDFYLNKSSVGMTDIEYMVHDYLHERALNWNKLTTAVESRHKWTRIQRFYAVPVLLLLLMSEIRSI